MKSKNVVVGSFEIEGRVIHTLELKTDNGKFGIVLGAAKCRLIARHIKAIKKFAKDHPEVK